MRVHNYMVLLAVVLTPQVTAAPNFSENSTYLPVVDLGYVSTFRTIPYLLVSRQTDREFIQELHRALWHNPDTDLYKFQNVRYGRSPTGDLRFRAPQSPLKNRTAVQTGVGTRICPQGQPQWQAKTLMAIGKYSNPTLPFTLEGWVEAIENGMVPPGNINANATEDCLLLDVHVPKKVLKAAGTEVTEGVPVLVFVS